MGTSTQMGSEFGVTLDIYDYSTRADRQILVQAFEKGKNEGLVNALGKMKAAGHIAVTGTLGYDCSYIRMIPTPTGRKIRFVTNRLLRFGEVYWDTRSTAYNLTAGELDLNDMDKSKSTGVFYPAAEFEIDKQGELQINLVGNPWKLVDVSIGRERPALIRCRGWDIAPLFAAAIQRAGYSYRARLHVNSSPFESGRPQRRTKSLLWNRSAVQCRPATATSIDQDQNHANDEH